mgnify:FL=1
MSSDLATKLNQSLVREVALRESLETMLNANGKQQEVIARGLAQEVLSAPSITEIEERLRAAKKDNLSGFYEWQIEKHSAEYEIEFRGNEIKSLQSQLKVAVEAVRKARGNLGYGSLETMPSTIKIVREILDTAISTLSQSGKEEKA